MSKFFLGDFIPSMKPGLSSLKFVRLVQPSIRVSTKAFSHFARGLIQLIRRRPFLAASSRPKAQTGLSSFQIRTNFKLPKGHTTSHFQISKLRWRADEKIKPIKPPPFLYQLLFLANPAHLEASPSNAPAIFSLPQ